MTAKLIDQQAATLLTTTGNATTIASFTVDSIASLTADLLATDGSNVAGYKLFAAAKNTGTVALVSTALQVVAEREDAGAASWSATIVANNGAMHVQVTGNAGVSINWFCHGDIVAYTP